MISALLYFGVVASNAALVLVAPGAQIQQFLTLYALLSIVAGAASIMMFSVEWGVRNADKVTRFVLLGSAMLVAIPFGAAKWIVYPIVLIFSDYAVSQSLSARAIISYRLILIATSAFLVFGPRAFVPVVEARIAVCLAAICCVVFIKPAINRLAIRRAYSYVVSTHLAYYLPLLGVAQFCAPDARRIWYLTVQFGGSLLLKRLDLVIRKSTSAPMHIYWFYIPICCFPVIGSLMVPSGVGLSAYVVTVLSVTFIERYTVLA